MPNTKTKKFDWQIFLAVSCILLVICCVTVCCVIGNTEKGVADAYTDEEVGVSNLEFTVDEGFYIKNFNYYDGADIIERLINYYFYFIPGLMDNETSFDYFYQVGYVDIYGTRKSGQSTSARFVPVYLGLSQVSSGSNRLITFTCYISHNYDLYFFDFAYDYGIRSIDEFVVYVYGTQSSTTPYNYYIDFTDSPEQEDTFANQLANEVFDSVNEISSIDSIDFYFNNTPNLGCILSPNETFANPPVVMPEGVYDENLQDKYTEGYDDGLAHYLPLIQSLQQEKSQLQQQVTSLQQEKSQLQQDNSDLQQQIQDLQNQINHYNAIIEELREEIRYYESLDLNLSTIEVFNPARMKASTFVYDGVTYTSNTIVSNDDGWDVYSTTYNNQELPPNYGVGFSLFLPEYITNTKFYVYGDITGWYNYTYCSEPDEQGNQQCYQVTDMIATISVGYRNQNGNIIKVGTFMSNLPGAGGVDFFIDSPTNEIVFFVENCNLLEVDRNTQVIYYYFDTESIYNDGYENGKSQGIKIGREEGYYEGVAEANDYSFFSLFTSVFDAPITAIVGKWGDSDGDGVYQREGGMLNFYIPGLDINFAPFLLSLFTIAIIILVIRFVMARKS